jgi:hypothetical protein
MKGWLLWFFYTASVLASSQGHGQQTRLEPVAASSEVRWVEATATGLGVQEAAKNAVKVTFPNGNGAYSGSGVYLGDRYIATAWHVPRGTSGKGYAVFRDGTRIDVEVNGKDPVWDQCILTMASEHPTLPGVELAETNPQIGERIYSVGFGQGFRIFGGAVTGYSSTGAGNPADWVNHQSPAVSGDSGGPIFTESGKLVGCLWGSGQGETLGSTTSRFQLFIRPLFPRLAQWRANRIARQIQGIAAIPQNGCYGGQCPPASGSPIVGGGPGRGVVSNPGNQPTPIDSAGGLPPALPQPPMGCDQETIKKLIAESLAGMDLKGDQGPAGPQGPKGDPGQVTEEHLAGVVNSVVLSIKSDPAMRGPAGKDAEVDLDKLAELVIAKIPPRRFILVDGATRKVIDDESYQSGEPIVLDIQQIIRSK